MDAPGPTALRDRGPELMGVSCFLTVFGTVFVLARFWARYAATRPFGWDDFLICFAMLAGLAGQGLTIAGVLYGSGKPFLTLDIADVVQCMKYSTFAIFCNGVAMALLKVGIGSSLLRLNLSKFFNFGIIACIVISLIVNLTVFPTTFAGCKPIEKAWNKDPTLPGTCWPRKVSLVMSYLQTTGNIVTDLAFSIGPLVYLSKVRVSRYNKWALRGVFMIGLTATACAIAKATELSAILNTQDPTYAAVNLTLWVKAEFNAGLFAASLPPLKSTFEKMLRKFGVMSGLSTPSNTHTYGGGYSGRKRYGEQSSRSKRQASMGYDLGDDDDDVHRTTYVMKDVSRSSPTNGGSMDEEQRQILRPGGSGGYITRTTEYSVSRATLASHNGA
ncbi:uncharacterized protein BDCG_05857 [Blastomyces dermatitidis ER-3]|uniref:Rhodopsin domain-containing protein n=2 Tax=Blastomyces TaxID=229219 RepID=A0A179UV83_BLAGS|nr:uncharacterized protein BDBG_06765 [Blastomyces gilchristii SLH14081]XP_045277415.1 uncharacterized protein BDCG_05857 [Blastomyces dermatitidis ER-3]EEQ90737.1 hypothetical protein BDCG_05857 [Blastomyces dermatitidis ER-3]OAT11007.1 hypothetical protein BDBG_06765 [Blastomyces gilchristii SLH14081]